MHSEFQTGSRSGCRQSELDLAEPDEFRVIAHLAQCPECRAQQARDHQFDRLIRGKLRRIKAPPALSAAIAALIAQARYSVS